MPSRFFFTLVNREDVIPDEEGVLVADAQSALNSAMEVIRELQAEDPSAAAEWKGWRLEITGEAGQVIGSLALDEPLSKMPSRH
ncbi:hypothetical protein [Microvirga sp. VF16]|uniref:DUF6894 family protein n=1 Tax=Microvirga sp. VF16 TaxID=2807101 RepID=UPI00193D0F59|nr:hypothetical protein [Microvirga sp. VF16]QRM27876.1 hypothetical protein JO965_16630 [Microvirga sp. VF16]